MTELKNKSVAEDTICVSVTEDKIHLEMYC